MLADANRRVARLQAEAKEEQLRSKMVKDRLRAEAEEQRLRAEIDASLEKRMRGDDG
jgi:nicotinamide mononucleotide adenylyltransferase